jgi:hypothetical protein
MEILLICAVINIRSCQSIANLNKTQLEILASKLLEISTSPFVSGTQRTKNILYKVGPLVTLNSRSAIRHTSKENEKY